MKNKILHYIKNISRRVANINSSMLPVFLLLCAILFSAGTLVITTNMSVFGAGDPESGSVQETPTGDIAITEHNITHWYNSGVTTTSYVYTTDTGGTALFICFQPKEVITESSNGLEVGSSALDAKENYLSGYTITAGFLDNGYKSDPWIWNGMGKIYAEYGTYGLSKSATTTREMLINDIIATDFADKNVSATNSHLLNALAFRSNAITNEMLTRGIVYIPPSLLLSDSQAEGQLKRYDTWFDYLGLSVRLDIDSPNSAAGISAMFPLFYLDNGNNYSFTKLTNKGGETSLYVIGETANPETVATKLDSATLNSILGVERDENKLRDYYLDYFYNKNIDLAYDVIDSVFSQVKNELTSVYDAGQVFGNVQYRNQNNTAGGSFQTYYESWMKSTGKLGSYEENLKYGIRQIQLYSALGAVIMKQRNLTSIDVMSNIEIHCLNTYGTRGSVIAEDKELIKNSNGAIMQSTGDNISTDILNLSGTMFLASTESIYAHTYQYDTRLIHSASKAYNFSKLTLDYTNDGVSKLGPGFEIKHGNTLYQILKGLGEIGYFYNSSATGTQQRLTAGADTVAGNAIFGSNNKTLNICDTWRQGYVSALISRQTAVKTNSFNPAATLSFINRGLTSGPNYGITFNGFTTEDGFYIVKRGATGTGESFGNDYFVKAYLENNNSLFKDNFFIMHKVLQDKAPMYYSLTKNTGSVTGYNPANAIVKGNDPTSLGLPKKAGQTTYYGSLLVTQGIRDSVVRPDTESNSASELIAGPSCPNIYVTGFNTYVPDNTILTLQENNNVYEAVESKYYVLNEQFYYLYNHTFYDTPTTGAVDMVMGFAPNTTSSGTTAGNSVVHEISMSEVDNYKLVLGINFSDEIIDLLDNFVDEDEEKFVVLKIKLTGNDFDKSSADNLTYFDPIKRGWQASKFDFATNNIKAGTSMFGLAQYGSTWLSSSYNSDSSLSYYHSKYETETWPLTAATRKLTSSPTASNKAAEFTYTIDNTDLEKILKNKKTARVGSDTTYMLKLYSWDANALFGIGGANLGSQDSETTLGADFVYTVGAEVIIEYVDYYNSTQCKRFVAKLETSSGDVFLDATGLGYMNQTYSRVNASPQPIIYGNTRKGESQTQIKNSLSYRGVVNGQNKDNLYGPSSDNHMYFSVTSASTNDWEFTGEITLEWDPGDEGAEEPFKSIERRPDESGEALIDADGVVSQLKINYSSESFTLAEFLDQMESLGVKYFGFTITEDPNYEGLFIPKDFNSSECISAITDEDLLRDKLTQLNYGQSLYKTLGTWNQGTIFYTIDQVKKLIGDAETTEASFNIGGAYIKELFRNDTFRNKVVRAASEGKITTVDKCNVLRLEYDFSLSIYAFGNTPSAVKASYVNGEYVPVSERTSGEHMNNIYNKHYLTNGILQAWLASDSTYGVDSNVTLNVTKGLKAIFSPDTDPKVLKKYDALELANRQAGRVAGTVLASELKSNAISDYVVNNEWLNYAGDGADYICAWQFNINDKGTEKVIVPSSDVRHFETGPSYREIYRGDTFINTFRTKIGDNLGYDMSSAWLAIGSSTPPPTPPSTLVVRTSSPVSYAQVKNGTWQIGTGTVLQDWNVLAGIPSTEKFYITSGGSEYIVELQATEIQAETATRMYESYFAGNSCKFKIGDISLAGSGESTATKNAVSHELNNESVVGTLTDKFNLPTPEGASTIHNSVKAHAGSTINATWTGTITNTTADPDIDNWKNPEDKESPSSTGIYTGKPGEMKKTGQENTGGYTWDITAYNAALEQAKDWASKMEGYSNADGNIITMSDSDHIVRSWHCGNAKITVTLSNLNDADLTNEHHTIAHRSSLTDSYRGTGTQSANTANYATLLLAENDARLSSGYFEVYGHAQEWIVRACHRDYNGKNVTGRFNEDVTTSWGGEKALADFNASRTEQSHEYISNYTWTGSETTCSASPVKTTIKGYPNWCGADWWTGSDATYSFCGKNYHVHSNACCPLTSHEHGNGCTCPSTAVGHIHDGSCCTLTPHTHDGQGCGCPTEAHKHDSSCLHVTSHSVGLTGHVCYANHDIQNWKKTTTSKAGPVSYKIEVNFEAPYTYSNGNSAGESDNVTGRTVTCPKDTVPEHSLCGPCCSHELPAISDHWYQLATYSTVSITDVSVLKISRSSVAGLNAITLDKKNENGGKYLVGNIKSGDLAIFYNIAYENQTYANSVRAQGGYGQNRIIGGVAGASAAGRIRYSVQAQQHDSVLWNEYNQNNVAKRTSECDGQAATNNYNPAPNGGQGHANKWSLGILYNRRNVTTGRATHVVNWLHTITNTSLVKTAYTTNSIDERDTKTLEFQRFDMRRDTEVITNVLTDTLILQGSTGGDKRIMYNSVSNAGSGSVKGGENKTTEEDSGKKDGLAIDIKKAFDWASYKGPTRTSGDPLYNYVYSGKGTDKTVLYDILIDISTPKDGLLGGYLGNGDGTLESQSITGDKKVSTLLDSNGTAYDATCNHPDAYASVPGPRNYTTLNIVTDGLNPANFRASAALFQKRTYPSNSLRIGQLDIQIDPTTQNGFYDATKATQTWFSILRYTEPDIVPEKVADWTLKELAYKPTETVSYVQGTNVFTQEAYYYGETTNGLLPSANKVNGILIHTPISSTHSYVTISEDLVYDQRTGIADNKAVQYTSTATCPGSAITCDYSYFDCKYGQDLVVYNTSFELEYTTTDKHGTSTKHQGILIDPQGYVVSVTDKVNSVTSTIKSGTAGWVNNATYGPGLTQVNNDYAIPLGILGVNYTTGTEIKLEVRGQITSGTPIYRCGNVVATVYSNRIDITNGRGTMTYPFTNGSAVHDFAFVISYNSLTDFKVAVDGKLLAGALTADSQEYCWQFDKEDWDTALYVGYRGTLYDVKLTHLAGTEEHVAGCYHVYRSCEKALQYLCDEVTRFQGESVPQAFTAPMDGTYLLELYNSSTGQYDSKYVELKEGQTIYAYLGTKGYWSYNGTDHASTEAFGETIKVPGQIQVSPMSSASVLYESRYDYGMHTVVPTKNVVLTPGIYRFETIGMDGTGYSGWYTVTNNSATVTVQHNASNNNELQIKKGSTVVLSSTGAYDSSSVQYLTKRTSARPGIAIYKYADLSGVSDVTKVAFSVTSDTLKTQYINNTYNTSAAQAIQKLALNPGTYKFNLLGAAGGGNLASGAGSRAGLGGQVTSYLNLDTATTFYAYPGGQGSHSSGTALGGFNGGGSATWAGNTIGAGGGASDIRVNVRDYTGASQYDSRMSYPSGTSYIVNNYSAAHDCLAAGPAGKYIQIDVYGSGLNTLTGLSHCAGQGQTYRDIYHTADHVTYIVTKADAYINSAVNMGLVFNANGARVDRIVMSALDSRVLVAGGGGGSDDTGGASGSEHTANPLRVSAASSNDNDESGGAGGGYIQVCTPDNNLGNWNLQVGTSVVLDATTNKNCWQLPVNGGVHIHTANGGLLPSYQDASITVTFEGTNTDKLVFRPTYHNGSNWTGGGYTATAVSLSSKKSVYKITATTNYPSIAFCIYNEGSAAATLNSVTVSDMTGRPPVTTGYTASFGYGTQTGCVSPGERVTGGFGFGGFYTASADYGGGGGGYYGGSSGGQGFQGGGGGSSYISGDPACDSTYLAYQKSNGNSGNTLSFYDSTASAGINSGAGSITVQGWEDTTGSASISTITVDTLVEKQQQYTTWVWNADQTGIILDNTSTQVIDFPYTGQVQRVTLNPGIYKLEAWGASGGYANWGSNSLGGQGGYTTGTITIPTTTTLYVYVGQAGQYGAGTNVFGGPTGTFNGGGAGGNSGSGSGGGATDFRLVSGIWNNADSLKSRILVAGGGGGADNAGGSMTTLTASNAHSCNNSNASISGGTITILPSQHSDVSFTDVLAAGRSYTVEFTAKSTVSGDMLHVDAFPDVLPQIDIPLTTTARTYRFDLVIPSDITPTGLRFFSSGELTSGVMTVSNIKIGARTSGDDGSGGNGGGLVGQTAYVEGVLTGSYGGGQTYGYAFGIGGSVEHATDSGGAGGGYYGGRVTNHNNGGAGGGSSYVSGFTGCDTAYRNNQKINGAYPVFTNVALQQGGNIGNGYARITKLAAIDGAVTDYETKTSNGYTWVKVLSHDSSKGLFSGVSEALHTGSLSTPAKYSILDKIDALKSSKDSKYVFMLYYPETGQTNIWKQSINPVYDNETNGDGSGTATGYEGISISMNDNYWGGLVRSTTGVTLLDGSTNHSNWFYAVGSYSYCGTGPDTIPGGNSASIHKVELWLATDNSLVASSSMPDGVSEYNDILTYAPTTLANQSAPSNSPYYWFNSSVKYNVAQVRLAAHEHTDKCKTEFSSNNSHTHSIACIDTASAMYKYMLYCAAAGDTAKLDELCRKYLGETWSIVLKSSNIHTAYSNLANLNIDISKMPSMVDGVDNLILTCLNHLDKHMCNDTCYKGAAELICNNIHHIGQHHTDTTNPICYSPCNDNENHGKTHTQIFDENYVVQSAINLESYFTVYWNNLGDFRENENLTCSRNPVQTRGQGYTQNMDTTRWIKRKCIKFKDIDVLYFNELTQSWELYKAGETIYLPVVTDGTYGNGDDDIKRDWRNANQNAVTSYHFYNLLSNGEYAQTSYTCWTEALNSISSAGQGNKPYEKTKDMVIDENPKNTNRDRGNEITNFTSLHSTKLTRTFDVMGNIGNLLITYTTDYRWSNFFKKADTSAWQVENILYNTYDDQQRYYLNIGKNTDNRDIRNHAVKEETLYFDTWKTEPWKQTKPVTDILCKELLSKQPEVWSKLGEDLKCGYDIYCEVTTIGDYSHLDVDYQYYVLDTKTGEVSCVDLWSNVSGNKQCYYLSGESAETINGILNKGSLQGFQGITSTNNIALYNLYNDFNTELKQRMITQDQIALTESINKKHWGISGLSLERTCIGNAYGIDLGMHNMLYVGSSYDNMSLANGKTLLTTGKYAYTSGITETNIGSRVSTQKFQMQARRWLFTAGVAENTTAVIYDGTKHVDLTTASQSSKILADSDRYRLLVGVDIKAYGGVWQIAYDAFDTTQNVLGVSLPSNRANINQYTAAYKPKAYYDIIAVYSLDSKEDDKDVMQSH